MKQCAQTNQTAAGEIVKISGPDTLETGKTIALTLEVATDNALCVQRAEGTMLANKSNYIQLGANLIHEGKPGTTDCDCYTGKTIYTLVYFTPDAAGEYVFGTQQPDSNTDHNLNAPGSLHIFAK